MKCPRCHGTGKVPNRTRYRVELRDSHQWYTLHFSSRGTTSLKQAIRELEQIDFAEENMHQTRDDCLKIRARVISISAKGKRRTLRERTVDTPINS
jgi:hypothetical protein